MKIERTDSCLYINLSIDEPVFKIKGDAISHDANRVLIEVIDWMNEYLPYLEKELDCEMEIYVIDDITYRNFIIIIEKLQEFISNGKRIRIIWYCDPEDEDMYEFAEDIGFIYEIPVEIKLKQMRMHNKNL